MDSILSQINKNNFRERGDKVYISQLLFTFLTDLRDTSHLRLCTIDEIVFIEIESITDDLRKEYGLFRTRAVKTYRNKQLDEEATSLSFADNIALNMEYDVLKAVERWEVVKHEFIDHFIDLPTIKVKSTTLSLLNLIDFNKCDLKYIRLIHQAIIKNSIDCELRLDKWEEFYKRYQWFVRTGFIRGLIRSH